jgi:galactokinase
MAETHGLDVAGGTVRRSSSRFCLGVEHGDYNGTSLFGVGTDKYIWLAFKANGTDTVRLYSGNMADAGVVSFAAGAPPPPPLSEAAAASWARFPHGVEHVLRTRNIVPKTVGFDAVLWGNIPGGGMSRSASLCLNLLATFLDVNDVALPVPSKGLAPVVDLAVAVENEYVGSPCGNLDQIMIYYAKKGAGTLYDPSTSAISFVQLGAGAGDFSIVALDTGTDRPGLDKSTYKVRRGECDAFARELFDKGLASAPALAAVADVALVQRTYANTIWAPHCRRLAYIAAASERFDAMLAAWRAGDVDAVGALFRADGIGLRDDYDISGRELETMCDIARTVPGVYGERMLGGGDKGAAGALVSTNAVHDLEVAVRSAYPKAHPAYADKFATHVVHPCDGITVLPNLL